MADSVGCGGGEVPPAGFLTAPLGYMMFQRRDGAFTLRCSRRGQRKESRLDRNISVEKYEDDLFFYISVQKDHPGAPGPGVEGQI